MQVVLNATDVRERFSEFVDDVVRKGPQFVKRNRDEWAALSKDQLQSVLSSFVFYANTLVEDDGSITLTLSEFGIFANGENQDKALEQLAEFLIEYSEEYAKDFELYRRNPSRRDHFPYIMNVLIQDNIDEVKSLIKCQHGMN